MFLKPDEFIGTMPEEYRKSADIALSLHKKLKNLLGKIDETKSPEEHKAMSRQVRIVWDMYKDMIGTLSTVTGYYAPGGTWNEKYCILSRIRGTDVLGHRSIVERLVINRLDALARGVELGTDDEFEASIEELFPRIQGSIDAQAEPVDKEADGDFDYVLLQKNDAAGNS